MRTHDAPRAALVALTWLGAAAAAPGLARAVGQTDLGVSEMIAVETAGTGERQLALAGADADRLAQHQRVLGRRDHLYVAFYGTGLLAGVRLLDGTSRALAGCVVAGAVVADIVENEALEAAFRVLRAEPESPRRADRSAALARIAAVVKFALLVPSVGAALAGVARGLRSTARSQTPPVLRG